MKIRINHIIFILFTLLISGRLLAQNDTTLKIHSPKKAAIMSAVIPGLGQFYNKKYWKIPVIYGGLSTLSYFIIENNTKYQNYKSAYQNRTDDIESTIDPFPNRTEEQLQIARDIYRSNLELSIILTAGVYILNIIDATVDAHLYEFNISDELSLRINPKIINSKQDYYTGISLTFNLK